MVTTVAAKLLVLGGGNMGSALVRGLLQSGWDKDDVTITEAREQRRAELTVEFPGVVVTTDPPRAEEVVLAVKPVDAEGACRELAGSAVTRVLSIMAGVTTAHLEAWLGPPTAVVRAMPNTPATVGAGVAAIAAGSSAGAADLAWAEGILRAVGEVVRVPEADLDAVTGLSGSGPAYVFLVAEALIAAGTEAGLPPATSRTLATATLAGAARLLVESGEGPERLRANVTSPGGTTEAGLAVLDARKVREAFVDAVLAATERSRELGDG